MRLFGLELRNPFVAAAIADMPATMPNRPVHTPEGLGERAVPGDASSDWYLALPDKLPPKQVSAILRGALAGNLWQQWQLSRRMAESWPMFRKCVFELQAAVAACKFVVHPYAKPGEKPTPKAIEKADLVKRAMEAFKPDRFKEEEGFGGMLFDLTDAVINGVSVVNLMWDEDAQDNDGRPEAVVKASAWVHPRHLNFRPDGSIGLLKDGNPLQFPSQVKSLQPYELAENPSRFLVAKFKSKSGSPLGAGFMRTLAMDWVTVVYGRDFARNFMQKWGNPFLDVPYKPGLQPDQIDKLEAAAKLAVNSGYLVHPASAEVKVNMPHSMGSDNAQISMMRLADQQCQMLILGQTLTSGVSQDGGSRALGDVHENVRSERIEGVAKWLARSVLTEQFAESLLIENYGEASERPTVEPDMTRSLSAQESAQYLQTMSNVAVPVPMDEVYKRAGVSRPAVGDETLIKGAPTILEESMTATDRSQQQFEQQLEQRVEMAQVAGELQGQPQADTKAATKLAVKFAQAEDAELDELERLVTAAERAPHANGELKAVNDKVAAMLPQKRFKV